MFLIFFFSLSESCIGQLAGGAGQISLGIAPFLQ
jgi:hypothetical protein